MLFADGSLVLARLELSKMDAGQLARDLWRLLTALAMQPSSNAIVAIVTNVRDSPHTQNYYPLCLFVRRYSENLASDKLLFVLRIGVRLSFCFAVAVP